jgi:hypothetical protein
MPEGVHGGVKGCAGYYEAISKVALISGRRKAKSSMLRSLGPGLCILPRIPLPRNPVNNLFGECAGLGSLASSLLAGKGYGKDVL